MRSEVAHDTAVYRACGRERQRLLERGAAIRRVRLDAELKSAVARKSESARAKDGRRAADAERHRVAEELGLPIDPRGRVLYPDAQIEYVDSEGRTGRVNIEVASGNYRARSIRAKVAAGFRMHANGPAAARLVREGKVPNAGRPGAPRIARGDLPHEAGALAESRLAAKPSLREVSSGRIVQSVIEEGIG